MDSQSTGDMAQRNCLNMFRSSESGGANWPKASSTTLCSEGVPHCMPSRLAVLRLTGAPCLPKSCTLPLSRPFAVQRSNERDAPVVGSRAVESPPPVSGEEAAVESTGEARPPVRKREGGADDSRASE